MNGNSDCRFIQKVWSNHIGKMEEEGDGSLKELYPLLPYGKYINDA